MSFITGIFPVTTDPCHLRAVGINSVGMTPIVNHPILAHANNEYLRIDSFYNTIKFYNYVLPDLIQ